MIIINDMNVWITVCEANFWQPDTRLHGISPLFEDVAGKLPYALSCNAVPHYDKLHVGVFCKEIPYSRPEPLSFRSEATRRLTTNNHHLLVLLFQTLVHADHIRHCSSARH